MDFKKVKDLNERIIEKAMPKVEKALLTGDWDCECMDAMTDAIRNYKNLTKIEDRKDMDEVYEFFKMNDKDRDKDKDREREERISHDQTMKYSEEKKIFEPIGEKTDFTYCIEDIIEKHGEKQGYRAIMTILNELMEDLKVLNNRMYNNTMMKLRDITH